MGLGVKLYVTHRDHDHGCGCPHGHEVQAGGKLGDPLPVVDGAIVQPGYTLVRHVPARMPKRTDRPEE
jgi:hypothetical protein